jgi:hypothetical protein
VIGKASAAGLELTCEMIGLCANRAVSSSPAAASGIENSQGLWSTRREKFRLGCS